MVNLMQSLALLSIVPLVGCIFMGLLSTRETWIGGLKWSNARPVWERHPDWSPENRFDDYTVASEWRR